MGDTVKPFNLPRKAVRRQPASTAYVERRLKEELGGLSFQGDGVQVGQSGDGRGIMLRVDPSRADHPFKCVGSGSGVRISPGYVRTVAAGGSSDWMPTIGGQPLETTTLAIGSNGWICLRMEFDEATGYALNTPWDIVFTTTPSEGVFRRALGDDEGESSPMDFAIAQVSGGQIVTPQKVRKDMSIIAWWNHITVIFLP